MKSFEDPVVEEVRRVRKQISAEFGHDIHKYMEHLSKLEDEMRAQGVKFFDPAKDRKN